MRDKEKPIPNKSRIGDFDKRISWSRRCSGSNPYYTMWICVGKKRFMVNQLGVGTRCTIAADLRSARRILRKVAYHDFKKEPHIKLSYDFLDRVEVSDYVKGQLQFEEDRVGPKSQNYFKQWLNRLRIMFFNSGIEEKVFLSFVMDNQERIQRDCENLVDPKDIVSAFKANQADTERIDTSDRQ